MFVCRPGTARQASCFSEREQGTEPVVGLSESNAIQTKSAPLDDNWVPLDGFFANTESRVPRVTTRQESVHIQLHHNVLHADQPNRVDASTKRADFDWSHN